MSAARADYVKVCCSLCLILCDTNKASENLTFILKQSLISPVDKMSTCVIITTRPVEDQSFTPTRITPVRFVVTRRYWATRLHYYLLSWCHEDRNGIKFISKLWCIFWGRKCNCDLAELEPGSFESRWNHVSLKEYFLLPLTTQSNTLGPFFTWILRSTYRL